MIARCAKIFGVALALCASLFGIDRDLKIAQLSHTAWTRKDGAPSTVTSLAQTTDGFLWVMGDTGLFRFDGLHFEAYRPPAVQPVPKLSVGNLLARPDGGLWIAPYIGAVSFLKDGNLTTYPLPVGSKEVTSRLVRDQQGVIWRSCEFQGLWRFVASHWERIPKEWDPPAASNMMLVDRSGTLWVDTSGHGISYLPKGAHKFQNLASFWGPVVELPTGTHLAIEFHDPIASIRPVEPGPVVRQFNVKRLALSLTWLVDDQGSLWVGRQGRGLDRTPYPERANGRNTQEMNDAADVFTQADGLTSNVISDILQDREGNIWVATDGGLDRFRQTPLISVKLPAGTGGFGLSARDDGRVWVTSSYGDNNFFEIQNGKAISMKPLRRNTVAVYKDPEGITYFASRGGLQRLANNKLEEIHFDFENTYPIMMTKDRAGRLIAGLRDRGGYRLDNGHWTNLETVGVPNYHPVTLFTDSAGHVWEGCKDNVVAQLDGEKLTTFTTKEGITVGDVRAVQSRNGNIWIGGEGGLERLDGRRFVTVAPADGSVFRGVKDILATPDDGIWVGDTHEVIHIEEAETRRVEQNPAYRVRYQSFDIFDGLSNDFPDTGYRPKMVQGTDGRLWFTTLTGEEILWLDPKRIAHKSFPPTPAILSVTANDHTYGLPAQTAIKLPPHTENVQFAYTAPSLAIPERVRFRYKLDGSDKEWRDAGSRRDASYTNLGPGSYRFHVMASNGEGGWNQAEAVTGFLI
jgi:ligand-binding sensor domain-containing protein